MGNFDGGDNDTSKASEDDAFSSDAFPASAVEPAHRPLGPSAWLELVGLPRGVTVSDGLRRDLARVACPEYLRGRAWKRLLEPAARRMQRRSVIPLSRLRQGALKGADAEGDALALEVRDPRLAPGLVPAVRVAGTARWAREEERRGGHAAPPAHPPLARAPARKVW